MHAVLTNSTLKREKNTDPLRAPRQATGERGSRDQSAERARYKWVPEKAGDPRGARALVCGRVTTPGESLFHLGARSTLLPSIASRSASQREDRSPPGERSKPITVMTSRAMVFGANSGTAAAGEERVHAKRLSGFRRGMGVSPFKQRPDLTSESADLIGERRGVEKATGSTRSTRLNFSPSSLSSEGMMRVCVMVTVTVFREGRRVARASLSFEMNVDGTVPAGPAWLLRRWLGWRTSRIPRAAR